MEVEAAGLTVSSLVERLGADNPRLARVLGVSALLADGVRVKDPGAPLDGTVRLDILPPFAGG